MRKELTVDAQNHDKKLSRRAFLKLGALAGFLGLGGTQAFGKAKAELPETDPTAVALGYKKDPDKVDFAKFPKAKDAKKKNEICKTCMFYKPTGKGLGDCTLFPNHVVAEGAWCNSWAKKA
jgi:hypothetical protein